VYINSNEVSIADLAAYCELTQNRILGLDLTKYPNVAAWMQRVEQVSMLRWVQNRPLLIVCFQLPHLNEVNETLDKVVAKIKSKL